MPGVHAAVLVLGALLALAPLDAQTVGGQQTTRGKGTGSAATRLSGTAPRGAWTIEAKRSQMTDQPTVTLILRAAAPIRTRFGSKVPSLILRCREGELNAYVNVGAVLDEPEVRLRWDDLAPVSESWTRSTDYDAVFAKDDREFILEGLLRHTRLRLEVELYAQGREVVTFHPTGLAAHLPRFARACPDADLIPAPPTEAQQVRLDSAARALAMLPTSLRVEGEADLPIPDTLARVRFEPGSQSIPSEHRGLISTGQIRFRVLVSKHGYPDAEGARVLIVTDSVLIEPARKALRMWSFHPATVKGRPVASVAEVLIKFGW